MKGFHHHENYPEILKCGSLESLEVQKFSDLKIFLQECCPNGTIFVRDEMIFTPLTELELSLNIRTCLVSTENKLSLLSSVIENIRRFQLLRTEMAIE